ncbi:MAG: ATP phosphoribosyltransferase regulatory subunit [Candidatus Dormibacteria bacterium]
MTDVTDRPGRASGFQDWVGEPATRRRAATDTFLSTFVEWGYAYLATPLVEPLETVAAGVDGALQSRLFRFMDADGSLLALVGERTVSVARVAATQMSRGPFPLRLCYAGPVLRNQVLHGGRRRESMQAGCELIGHAGLAADAEGIAVAAQALQRAGVRGVQIDVGHADFVPALLDSAGLRPERRADVARAMRRRDLVAVEAALEGTDIAEAERALLLAFPTLRGGRDILGAAAQRLTDARPRAVLEELAGLWDLLESHDIIDRVHLDLGAVRDWDYYTGVTYELFSSELGFPLGVGGRYDRLLSSFGLEAAATGFVLHVDRCIDATAASGDVGDRATAVRLSWAAGSEGGVHAVARRMRDAGIPVACDLEARSTPPAGDSIHLSNDGTILWNLRGRTASGTIEHALRLLREE